MVAQPQPIEEILPVWTQVQAGQAKWEDFTFEERTERGWLTPTLIDLDLVTHRRWDFWMRTIMAGEVLQDEPIPRIDWLTSPHAATMKMLEKCLDHWSCNSGARLPDFFEWLLWGFGRMDRRARVDAKVNEHWYRTFNLDLMMQNPHDYLGQLMQESKGSGRWGNPNAFFATPHSLVEMMVRMSMGENPDPAASVCDPCVGSGRMLLHASNYSLNLYGMDIDYVCCMACTLNAIMYVPWMIHPAPWLARRKENPIEVGDALQMLPPPSPEEIHDKVVTLKGKKKSQLTLF